MVSDNLGVVEAKVDYYSLVSLLIFVYPPFYRKCLINWFSVKLCRWKDKFERRVGETSSAGSGAPLEVSTAATDFAVCSGSEAAGGIGANRD